ncbi:MBL fold metallo-hydrolase [Cohnella zeiphila]|uniref:MBL fold metallo-hydrolase n=1 Tax=Cohnella zeiphila TaxID=2761120 RepID=A0A7X0VX63_9BACL|nr:MBL fold metallo-hydrolase [Cohnella zeiphila]MBB6733686.1 MBL fold metallo-hydrolase [Cohnella zeiphila]
MDQELSYGSDDLEEPLTPVLRGAELVEAPDLICHTVRIVNVVFAGDPATGDWVLVDAGLPNSAGMIVEAAERRFGTGRPPRGIVLTHGHFDHIGAIVDLIGYWGVPVLAHESELPYLTGQRAYDSPVSSVEGGLVAKMSAWFPNELVRLSGRVEALPRDGTIPMLPDWRWVHTPGHTPGHISLFRERDRSLIAGDAFTTVRQDSVYKVITQKQEISGPPHYFTPDWASARESVKKLEELKPARAITGHGMPIAGEELAESLRRLVCDFDKLAVPSCGKYVN